MAGQVDTSGALAMVSRGGEVFLDRPSRDWGRARNDRTDDPVVGELQQKRDLLLVNIRRHAYVDVYRDTADNSKTLDQYEEVLITALNPPRQSLFRDEDSRRGWMNPTQSETGPFPPAIRKHRRDLKLEKTSYQFHEWEIEQKRGGQTWSFIIRVYKKARAKPGDPMFAVRAYTPKGRLADNEAELRHILDSVHIEQ
jgi:hypothetical protein